VRRTSEALECRLLYVRRLAFLVAGVALLAAGCGKSSSGEAAGSLVIAVDVPVTGSPYVAQTIRQGVELATSNLNSGGGIRVGSKSYLLKVKVYDNRVSATRAVQDARQALDAGAVTIITDGTGVDATWPLAKAKGVSIGITYDGGSGLVDPQKRPNIFRIAPTNHGIAFRYAEYLIPKGLKVALLSDDSAYGREGGSEIAHAFSGNPRSVALKLTLPAGQTDLTPQILRARRAGATALLVWAQPPTIAAALSAARSTGWKVPVYTPPSGADPFIRQQLADHPDWVDGLTFASGRMTAEVGTGPFLSFQSQYESTYGADKVGVKTKEGETVVQPPEFAMYPYDFVHVLVAAITHADSVDPAKITAALDQVTTQGANGDERGFNEHSHEGVVDDDVYFARFHNMTYAPVRDDPLSTTLPSIPQTQTQ
jgi:branched-chain amino acid transport system substrate-binding protein